MGYLSAWIEGWGEVEVEVETEEDDMDSGRR